MGNNLQISKFNLSERETEVFKLVLEGYSNREIAQELFISIETVKAHMTSILYKIGVEDRLGIFLKLFNKSIKEFLKSFEE